ncbi:hypothetical protein [Deinococcus soli (ex Cha et al. 2016)]|uniref:Uncharacterized protein n=2 Tax=Deinococcus soli (ex Cha et al. 2016) TaxID=1309411 RepID=A0AAE4BN78_9DEIO|nr:hypothetical protein [Deinococcus soli (ex Cha et al. 2016)]MDR6218854.1 hypothetical protein [Deinococcus soli (ex Cha et al. 2016)]MDR6328651.1 hypothetical protein [Deinococcus soli (ex Cha et al. 2016)]MDR6751862.1 hypothetical protein [Deinococcus soli (ex Cha et al. 2016)]
MRKEDAHSQARRLKTLLRDEHGLTLGHSQAQHLTARSLGFTSWQELRAQQAGADRSAADHAPTPAAPTVTGPLSLRDLQAQAQTNSQRVVRGVVEVSSTDLMGGDLDDFLTLLSEKLTGFPDLMDVNYAFVGVAGPSALLAEVTGQAGLILERYGLITSAEEARGVLDHLPCEQADRVYEYTLEGERKYGTPVTVDALRDNADHLAEEEDWDEPAGETLDSPEADALANSVARNGPWEDTPDGVTVYPVFGGRGSPAEHHPNSLTVYRSVPGSDSMDGKETVQGDDPRRVRAHTLGLLRAYHADEPGLSFFAIGTLDGAPVKLYRSNRLTRR